MIKIKQSKTADTRTCDVSLVDKETLLASSMQHIGDVGKALAFFSSKLTEAASQHDYDKLTDIDWFLSDFKTKFEKTGWWDNHRKIHRHHLVQSDGIPSDVNLIDVLEYISDCVMAGMARSGSVYALPVDVDLLTRAFNNTIELLKSNVEVELVELHKVSDDRHDEIIDLKKELEKQSASKDEGCIRVKTNQETGEEFPDGEWRKDPYVTSGRIAKRLNLPECFEYGVIFTKRKKSEPMPKILERYFVVLRYMPSELWYVKDVDTINGVECVAVMDTNFNTQAVTLEEIIQVYNKDKEFIWSKTDDEK